MAKPIEILGRHCIICNKYWMVAHPHDLNSFCPECHKALTELINNQKKKDKRVNEREDE